MSTYPVALVLAIAAGREDDLLNQLSGVLSVEDSNILRVEISGKVARFMYRRVVSEGGVDAVAIASRPSSGTAQQWHLWILQPLDCGSFGESVPPTWVKAFRDRLAAWASDKQPTGGGLWHLLGPFTPAKFKVLAPAAIWDACVFSWHTYARAEASAEGVAAQQLQDNGDLE